MTFFFNGQRPSHAPGVAGKSSRTTFSLFGFELYRHPKIQMQTG
jgi:hypothetical protein